MGRVLPTRGALGIKMLLIVSVLIVIMGIAAGSFLPSLLWNTKDKGLQTYGTGQDGHESGDNSLVYYSASKVNKNIITKNDNGIYLSSSNNSTMTGNSTAGQAKVVIGEVKIIIKPPGSLRPAPREMITSVDQAKEIVNRYLKDKFGEDFVKEHFVINGIDERSDIPHVWFINLSFKSHGYEVNMHIAVDTWWKPLGAERVIPELSNIIDSPQEILISEEEAEDIAAKAGLPQPYKSILRIRNGRIVWVVMVQNIKEYPIGKLVEVVIDAETGDVLARIPRPPFLSNSKFFTTNQSTAADHVLRIGSNFNQTSRQEEFSSSNIYILSVENWVKPPDKLLLGEDQTFEAWGCNDDVKTHKLYFKFSVTLPDGDSASAESDHIDVDPGYCFGWPVTVLGSWAGNHGVGISNFKFELWEDIAWWPDTKHDEYASEYWTVFPKPFESDVYYCDNDWHHPSDARIVGAALQAAAGKTTPRDAVNALKTYVHNTVTYDESYSERSSDLEVLSTKRGVCVDFADLYIGLARSLNIPTRYVASWTFGSSCKLWDICGAYCNSVPVCWGHVWAESYYAGNWHHVDPTWNVMENPKVYINTAGVDHIHAAAYTRSYDPYQQNCNWFYDVETLSNGHVDVTTSTDGGYDYYYYCPSNIDGDGYCDNLDADRDNDGISNVNDKCICVWGPACNSGCPDNSPPGTPYPICEGGGDWINDNTPTVSWSHVSDEGCGVYGYEYAIDQTSSWTNIGYTTSFQTPQLSNGEHTVYVRAYDGAGNRGNYGSCNCKIDTTSPSNPGSIASNPSPNQWTTQKSVTFSWSGASDTYSGVKGYYYKIDGNSGTTVGTSDSFTSVTSLSANLTDGKWYLHIRTVDNAGNLAPDTKHYGPIEIDTTPPVPLDMKINNDAEYTNNRQVYIHLVAGDGGSGIKRYYLRNEAGDWQLIKELSTPTSFYEDTISWTLTSGDGDKCVFLDIRDDLGNSWWSYSPIPSDVLRHLYDCIKLDTTPPPAPSLTSPEDGSKFIEYQANLQWQAVSDPSPGQVDHYVIELDTSSSFNSPNKKTYTTTSTGVTTDPLNVGLWYWRVRAEDKAGNPGPWSETRGFRIIGNPDSDNSSELSLWRPSNGYWYILTSASSYDYRKAFMMQWGSGSLNDIPLLGYMDADGLEDLVVWRPSNGYWYVLKSSTGYSSAFVKQWGSGSLNDKPLIGDVDGDGKGDLIIWRPSNGRWYVLLSSRNYDPASPFIKQWGTSGDIPLIASG